jgi:hypothetical protein
MSVARWFVVLAGCASSTPAPPPPPPIVERPPVVAATPADAAPSPPPATPADAPARAVTATIVEVMTAGPRPRDEVRRRFEDARGAIAACGSEDSIALPLELAITADGTIPHVTAAGDVDARVVECVAHALGAAERDVPTAMEPTDVYAVIALDVDGRTPAVRPPALDLKVEFEDMCSMFKRSGALAEPAERRREAAIAYFHAHVRHPELRHFAWTVFATNPADRPTLQPQLRKRIKPRVCEDPGW